MLCEGNSVRCVCVQKQTFVRKITSFLTQNESGKTSLSAFHNEAIFHGIEVKSMRKAWRKRRCWVCVCSFLASLNVLVEGEAERVRESEREERKMPFFVLWRKIKTKFSMNIHLRT